MRMPKNKSEIMGRKLFLQYLLLVLPGFIIFTIGLILPLLLSFRYSVTSWDGISPEKVFVGFRNYMDLFKDDNFRSAWWFTIKFTIGNTLIQNAAALLFGSGKTVLWGLLIANNWQWIGYWMLIYLAGLQSVPSDLYEAAKVDGAGAVKRFFNVTIPMLAPAITICVVGITTGSLKVYDLLVSSTKGGPGRASTSVIYQTYTTAINGRQYGYGSAMTVTLVVALLLVALIQVKGLKSKEVQA